ncbi:flagellar hook-associated protein FlgL [Pseudomonas wenzhouensis]|nr:flagellar hook-associated protein FlgL [Pseudomonas wenzhouensis]MDM9651004.1 flagellar hook-associated protein FlgL [Pseudomonas wenzhouensis]
MRISTSQVFNGGITSQQRLYSNVNKAYEQVSSGLRIQTAGDDPVGAARLLQLQQQDTLLEQYNTNLGSASDSLMQEDAILSTVTNVLQRARELALSAGNGAYSDEDRQAVADELEQVELQLYGLMNSKDAAGRYLFAGSDSSTQPFLRNADGSYTYQGDQNQHSLQVSTSLTLATGDNGWTAFYDIPSSTRTESSLTAAALAEPVSTPPAGQISRLTLSRPQIVDQATYDASFEAGVPYTLTVDDAGNYSVNDGGGTAVATGSFALAEGSTTVTVNGVEMELDLAFQQGDSALTSTELGALLNGQSFTFGEQDSPRLTLSQGLITDSLAYGEDFRDGSPYSLKVIDGSQFAVYDSSGDDITAEVSGLGNYDAAQEGGFAFTLRGVEMHLDSLGSLDGENLDELFGGYTFSFGTVEQGFSLGRLAGNASTVQMTGGSVTDSATYDARFPGNGVLVKFTSGTDYEIHAAPLTANSTPLATGTVASYPATFNVLGVDVSLASAPQTYDQFSVQPKSRESQSILDTISQLRQTLLRPVDGDEEAAINLRESLAAAISNLDNGMNRVFSTQSSVGSRLNVATSLTTENETMRLSNETLQSAIRDADPTEAIIELNQQATILEAAQLAFSKISQLSLFNKL